MATLVYRTRGNSAPQGKRRVYIAAHPADYEYALPTLIKEILDCQNVAVYYDEAPLAMTKSKSCI